MRNKVTVIGAGNVGATCAQRIAELGYADVVLVDVLEGLAQGKALDMLESGPVVASDSRVIGTNGYEETADSDIAIITSGVPRKPGMSRDDLILTNMEIVKGVTESVVKRSPNCILILVTNPLDAMCQLALHVSKFPKNRVVGMSGILDNTRCRTFLAMELDVSVEDVFACVLGGHGDSMVPCKKFTTVSGIPIESLIREQRLKEIIQRTREGGAEIVKLLKTGSAYYAPSAAAVEMVEAVLLDQKKMLPCSVYCKGEYGIKNTFAGVPVILGAGGVREIVLHYDQQ